MTKIWVRENVKNSKGKATDHLQGTPTKQRVDFFWQKLWVEDRVAWPDVFNVIIGKNLYSRIPELPRLSFRFERKIKTFRDKQKQKQFSTTEILKVIRYSSFQSILQSYSHQNLWYWHKNRHTDQWNWTKSPEISPHLHDQSNHDKEGKNVMWGKTQKTTTIKNSLFNKLFWEYWIATCKRIKLGYSLIKHTTINSKWRIQCMKQDTKSWCSGAA